MFDRLLFSAFANLDTAFISASLRRSPICVRFVISLGDDLVAVLIWCMALKLV